MAHVWIIEMFLEGKWQPTIGCGLTRDDANMKKRAEWAENCPGEKFRVKRYNQEIDKDG